MHSCLFCLATYDTRGQRDHHQGNCQGVITLQYPNGAITLIKDHQGQYICHCTHPNCPRPFKGTRGLQKHVQKAGLPWNDTPKVSVAYLSQNLGVLKDSPSCRMPTQDLMQKCQQCRPKRPHPLLPVAKSTMPCMNHSMVDLW